MAACAGLFLSFGAAPEAAVRLFKHGLFLSFGVE
jgi:hypothetical protein